MVALVVAEVDRLDVRVETLAEAHAAAQARLDGLIQAAHRAVRPSGYAGATRPGRKG